MDGIFNRRLSPVELNSFFHAFVLNYIRYENADAGNDMILKTLENFGKKKYNLKFEVAKVKFVNPQRQGKKGFFVDRIIPKIYLIIDVEFIGIGCISI